MTTLLKHKSILLSLIILFVCCGSNDDNNAGTKGNPDLETTDEKAIVVSVTVSGNENAYTFSVGVQSPDQGCDQFANWWEVITEDGNLLYRRLLNHSHVNEQPFIRSGGSVNISSDQVVIVRAHMNSSGYGVVTYKGSVANGFERFTTADDFALTLENEQPLSSRCDS